MDNKKFSGLSLIKIVEKINQNELFSAIFFGVKDCKT